MTKKPSDHAARSRIERELDRTFLVEAGAGSVKTHSLARRMAAGIAGGAYRIDQLAAGDIYALRDFVARPMGIPEHASFAHLIQRISNSRH
jgi:hypothetical protein